MTQVTVKELAQVVDTPVERLLLQMRDAGLPHTSAEQVVTDSEKQALLTHLKGSHGDRASEPRKRTMTAATASTPSTVPRSRRRKRFLLRAWLHAAPTRKAMVTVAAVVVASRS